MTESLNQHRRGLMAKARKHAEQAQHSPVGLIRGDLIRTPYEDLLDTCIELLRVCPIELMTVPPAADVVPCAGCDTNMPVTRSGKRYCSDVCRRHTNNQDAYDRRKVAA